MMIKEGMSWPPQNVNTYKMQEHAAWYSGDPDILADFYATAVGKALKGLTFIPTTKNTFWGRQIKNNEDFFMHVPIAGDLAETSASFLFGETPIIRVNNNVKEDSTDVLSDKKNTTSAQEILDKMLIKTGFFQKLLEGAESASAIGGVYIKIAWDSEVCEYPIPVIVQADCAMPEFKYGFLTAVTFPYEYKADEHSNKIFRLMERYEKGRITNTLYEGSTDNLGKEVPLTACEDTKDLEPEITTIDEMLAVYIPNLLPNRLDRNGRMGRSDLSGIETLMDSLDETFSAWMNDVQIARGRIHIPESYLEGLETNSPTFNMDKRVYVKLDVDPSNDSQSITATQFAIRSADFEKTCLNLLDRIITSAGYSPQSFGLNIAGRAESGTALDIRERKSFATTNKKQTYWEEPIKHIVKCMCLVYAEVFGGTISADIDINVEFADGISNNLAQLSNSIKTLSDAKAISTDTMVRMVHPEWNEEQIKKEIELISSSQSVLPPDGFENPDMNQMKKGLEEEEEVPGAGIKQSADKLNFE